MARILIAILLAVSIPALPALADKPPWAGKAGKGHEQGDDDSQGESGHDRGESHSHFSKHDHDTVHAYYVEQYGIGHCPPGLAKKHNGCLPPGHAKKRYAIGRPLPAGFVLVPVPVELSVRLGPPPIGCRYGFIDGDVVRVAELATGTLLVVDAINGLMH